MISIDYLDTIVEAWLFKLDIDDITMSHLTRILDRDEHRSANSFRFEKNRGRFVASREQMRDILAAYTQTKPELIFFNYSPHGKLGLGDSCTGNDAWFSMSNSDLMSTIAITYGMELGLDIERVPESREHELIVTTQLQTMKKTGT